ncbi:MAG: type IX secretion system PorP/SprF family membrane protein [Crocinitomicaceae bacterium]|jgi:type IX secretion system PorP/SprF family membrane protein
MKMTLKNIGLGLGVALLTSTVWSQDIHFSNAEYSPMNLNPGLTGVHARMQANVNYRTQWRSVATPYNTIAASVEMRFNEQKRQKKGIIAGGLNFYNDKVGNLPLSTNKFNLSFAYHLILDRTSTIGIGLYGGFGQRTLEPTDGHWGNQYDGTEYNSTLPSNEVFASNQFGFFDAGTGIVYNYKSGGSRGSNGAEKLITGGLAFYHVNNPNYSFINNEDETLPLRWSVFANATISLQNKNGAIMPGFYFNRQKSNMEILYGTYYRFTLGDGNVAKHLGLGVFHRWGDALIVKSFLQIGEFTGGVAYDFNISSLSGASSGRGGMEVFMRYQLGPKGFSRSQI